MPRSADAKLAATAVPLAGFPTEALASLVPPTASEHTATSPVPAISTTTMTDHLPPAGPATIPATHARLI
jgi:hypothetical protein